MAEETTPTANDAKQGIVSRMVAALTNFLPGKKQPGTSQEAATNTLPEGEVNVARGWEVGPEGASSTVQTGKAFIQEPDGSLTPSTQSGVKKVFTVGPDGAAEIGPKGINDGTLAAEDMAREEASKNSRFQQATAAAGNVAGQLSDVMRNGSAQHKVATGVGGVAAMDGTRRMIGGMKKDETGKRNVKAVFAGAVETAIGAVSVMAASKAHGQDQNMGEFVKAIMNSRGGKTATPSV